MSVRKFVLACVVLAAVLLVAPVLTAERERSREESKSGWAQPPERDRGDGRERSRPAPPADRDVRRGDIEEGGEEATEDGMPAPRRGVAPEREPYLMIPRWRLGVFAYNTPTGVVITRVIPQSPAWGAGLERGDRIVTVTGYQVGYVGRELYALGEELQLRGGRNGRVRLLVSNSRNGRLVNLDVQLERRGPWER